VHFLTQNSKPWPISLAQPFLSGEDATSQHFLPRDGNAGHRSLSSIGQFQNSQQFCGPCFFTDGKILENGRSWFFFVIFLLYFTPGGASTNNGKAVRDRVSAIRFFRVGLDNEIIRDANAGEFTSRTAVGSQTFEIAGALRCSVAGLLTDLKGSAFHLAVYPIGCAAKLFKKTDGLLWISKCNSVSAQEILCSITSMK
jgi:hypothetical protein